MHAGGRRQKDMVHGVTVFETAVRAEAMQCKYWHGQIAESKGNMKKLWQAFRSVLGEATSSDVQELTSDDFACSETRSSLRRCTTFRTRRHRH